MMSIFVDANFHSDTPRQRRAIELFANFYAVFVRLNSFRSITFEPVVRRV